MFQLFKSTQNSSGNNAQTPQQTHLKIIPNLSSKKTRRKKSRGKTSILICFLTAIILLPHTTTSLSYGRKPPPTPSPTISTFNFQALKYTKLDSVDDARALFRLHDHVDDDDDGRITLDESNSFRMATTADRKSADLNIFEEDTDGAITFEELWAAWIESSVHNWTNEELILWLQNECEIDTRTYIEIFENEKLTGVVMPRLALNDFSYLKTLKIKSFLIRRRIQLKAMDAVLYSNGFKKIDSNFFDFFEFFTNFEPIPHGPPRKRHSIYKDVVVVFACILAVSCLFFAVVVRNRIGKQMAQLEAKLAEAHEENSNLGERTSSANTSIDGAADHDYYQSRIKDLEEEVGQLQEEISTLKNSKNNKALNTPFERAPSKEFLQLLRECKLAEEALVQREHRKALKMHEEVRSELDKIQKKKNTLFGAVQLLHGEGLERLDHEISHAKQYIEKVSKMKAQSQQRWRKIYLAVNVNVLRSSVMQKQLSNGSTLGRGDSPPSIQPVVLYSKMSSVESSKSSPNKSPTKSPTRERHAATPTSEMSPGNKLTSPQTSKTRSNTIDSPIREKDKLIYDVGGQSTTTVSSPKSPVKVKVINDGHIRVIQSQQFSEIEQLRQDIKSEEEEEDDEELVRIEESRKTGSRPVDVISSRSPRPGLNESSSEGYARV